MLGCTLLAFCLLFLLKKHSILYNMATEHVMTERTFLVFSKSSFFFIYFSKPIVIYLLLTCKFSAWMVCVNNKAVDFDQFQTIRSCH
jgi:hypothetical protein